MLPDNVVEAVEAALKSQDGVMKKRANSGDSVGSQTCLPASLSTMSLHHVSSWFNHLIVVEQGSIHTPVTERVGPLWQQAQTCSSWVGQ